MLYILDGVTLIIAFFVIKWLIRLVFIKLMIKSVTKGIEQLKKDKLNWDELQKQASNAQKYWELAKHYESELRKKGGM